ncbi:DUF397 domain-containing protein [Umezawaea sp.]|uniref:DUF397 domain-containing protein n=1 Tax=Umezawaea sp. TaxID=1955258 RepID=UPI002ED056BA
MHPDLDGAVWRKSSYSGGNGGECVELAFAEHVIGVRDSKNPKVALAFGRTEMDLFLRNLRHDRFDV